MLKKPEYIIQVFSDDNILKTILNEIQQKVQNIFYL